MVGSRPLLPRNRKMGYSRRESKHRDPRAWQPRDPNPVKKRRISAGKYYPVSMTGKENEVLEHRLACITIPSGPDIAKKVRKATKQLFRIYKFLKEDDDDDLTNYCYKVLDVLAEDADDHTMSHFAIPEDSDDLPDEVMERILHLRFAFVNKHKKLILSSLNATRTNTQAAVTAIMKKTIEERGKLWKETEIYHCAKRQLLTPDPRAYELFLWYSTKLLPAVTGMEIWGEKYYLFEKLSSAYLDDNPRKLRVPPSTEALAATMYANVLERVNEEYKQKMADAGEPLKGEDDDSDDDDDDKENDNKVDRNSPSYRNLWGLPESPPGDFVEKNCGSNLYGGWYAKDGQPGIKYFIRATNDCIAGRQREEDRNDLEDWVYNHVRKPQNGFPAVTGRNWEEWVKIRKAHKKGRTILPKTDDSPPDWGAYCQEI